KKGDSRPRLSRRNLIVMSGFSAGTTLLARRPLFADQNEIMSTTDNTKGEYTMAQANANAVRPFTINVPEAELTDLRRRINATRWPEQETVADQSQGMPLATIRELARYWGTDYDWRKAEAELNALPQFVTTIDGLNIHFIHVRSREKNALPVIITH